MSILSADGFVDHFGRPLPSLIPSPLSGTPLLAIGLDTRAARATASEISTACRALAELPVVTAGVGAVNPHWASVAERVDLLVESEEALAPISEAVTRNPLASVALVQQLRLGETLTLHEGLVTESALYGMLQVGPEHGRWLESRASRPDAEETTNPPVRVERDGAHLRLTLDRPERRNAFSYSMRDGLVEALEIVIADPSITTVILDGAGPCFSSGGDLDEFGRAPDPATAHAVRSTRNVARLLARCGERVVAHVHGATIGAGIELAALCHRVVASPDAFFQLPEVGMGLIPGAGGTVSLPRRIGRQRTARMAITGARVDAATARSWGLVDEIEPH